MVGTYDGTEPPVFSLPADDCDATVQVAVANMLYPIREKVLTPLAFAFLGLAMLTSSWPDLDASEWACVVGIWAFVAALALIYLSGERGYHAFRRWVLGRRKGRLHYTGRTSVTGVSLYEDRLEYEDLLEWRNRRLRLRAPYSQVAFAVIYGDLLVISLHMTYSRPPEVCADVSGLSEGERAALVRYLEARVNAVRRTREYRRSVLPKGRDDGLSDRVVAGLWRWTLALFSVLFVAGGVGALASGDPVMHEPAGVSFCLFLVLLGLAILDGLRGRMISGLRRHPTRRRLRVARMRRWRPVG